MKQPTINDILSLDEPRVDVGDFLFSDKEQRRRWVEVWAGDEKTEDELEELAERVEALYRFSREAMQTDQNRKQVRSPSDVISKLSRERISYPAYHWVVWPLDAQYHHQFKITPYGTRSYQRVVSQLVPRKDELPPVPKGGGYIVVFMGNPESVLSKEGVRKALANLCRSVTVHDVIFRKFSGQERVYYSVRAGEGYYRRKDGQEDVVEFDPSLDLSWFKETN